MYQSVYQIKNGLQDFSCNPLYFLVGAARFELATTCTPCRYATRLRYAPTREKYIRAGETIRLVSAQQLDDVFQLLLQH